MFLMSRLCQRLISKFIGMPLLFFCLLFLVVKPTSAQTNTCNFAPQPNSQEIDNLIEEVQSRGGATALVPASVIKAVYFIEALPYYIKGSFICKKNKFTALGLWQIVDGEYHSTVPENQQLDNDEYVCQAANCKLSRCNAADAVEIFSRALLDKIKLWHESKLKPLGKIESIEDIMYSTGRYYGLFVPDQYTNNLIEYLPQNQRYPSGHQNADTITYPEFVCAKSGYCKTYQDYLDRNYLGSTYLDYSGKKSDVPFTFDACGSTTNISVSTNNPLRPNPFDLVKEEQQRQISDPNLALYCAQRPTVVKPALSLPLNLISGTLYSNFNQFTTPLLSLSMDKAQTDESRRFLADYLEGRAYYETTPEPQNPDFFQQVDIFFRSGVFRKLAPASYQDQLKNAIIQRASGRANTTVINRIYGFPTATTQVHDYELNTPYGKFKLSQLAPKPLNDPQALKTWQNSPTAKIWSYVPMFTREDTKGFVQAVDEPGQYSSQAIEVIHPHLARTYEVSSALSGLLTPLFPPQNPDLAENFFTPAPWDLDSEKPWWLESDQNTANQWNQSAPVCEPQTVVYGPGDLAKGGAISTSVYKSTLLPPVQDIRYSPTYLITHTPFLEQIAANLITGPHAVFSALSPLAKPVTEDWPAAADYNEKNPQYYFSAGRAEAGYKKSGSLGQFFYKYLGSIICQEEKTLAWLQPFFLGQSPSSSLCKTTPSATGTQAGTDLSGLAGVCPEGGQEITAQLASQMQNGHEQFLPNTVTARSEDGRLCITPTTIVIHWSGGWDNDQGNDATYGTLIQRNLACQLASDTNDTILMQPFYETQVEYPWCAGAWNIYSINNELAGGYIPSPGDPEYGSVDIRFTDESGNPSRIGNPYKPSQTVFPEKSVVDHAVSAACAIMKQYNIPWTQIYGHYQVPNSGKPDPGKEFLENWFIPRVKNECH